MTDALAGADAPLGAIPSEQPSDTAEADADGFPGRALRAGPAFSFGAPAVRADPAVPASAMAYDSAAADEATRRRAAAWVFGSAPAMPSAPSDGPGPGSYAVDERDSCGAVTAGFNVGVRAAPSASREECEAEWARGARGPGSPMRFRPCSESRLRALASAAAPAQPARPSAPLCR